MYNGIINVFKEKGYTSHDVVAKLRGILKMKKIGHTVTLDPDATGVLPVCLGSATKLCDLLTDKDKKYHVIFTFGFTTDTQDVSGKRLKECDVLELRKELSDEVILKAIHSFVGPYMQKPPMYSALKVNGQKLCDIARAGIEIEREKRLVTIYSIEDIRIDYPKVSMTVACSKGTYIRTLCEDIGTSLNTYACLLELTRTRVKDFFIKDALKISEIEEKVKTLTILEYIYPVESFFTENKKVYLKENAYKYIDNGNSIENSENFLVNIHDFLDKERVNIYTEDKFRAVYEYIESDNILKPYKMFIDK